MKLFSKPNDESTNEQDDEEEEGEEPAASNRNSTKDRSSDDQDASASHIPGHRAANDARSNAQGLSAPDLSERHASNDGIQPSQPPGQPPPVPLRHLLSPSEPPILLAKEVSSLCLPGGEGSSSAPPPPGSGSSTFVAEVAKELIGSILREKLTGVTYNRDEAPHWARDITEAIKAEFKNLQLDNYKIVVQAAVGQPREQGLQLSCRCFWDPKTDNYAHESFANDSIFCIAGAFVMYMY